MFFALDKIEYPRFSFIVDMGVFDRSLKVPDNNLFDIVVPAVLA